MRLRQAQAGTAIGALLLGSAVLLQGVASAASTQRLAGSDRYETAAVISEASFEPGVPVAFVAVGTDFPDALAGTPAAAELGGPVLPTLRDSVPQRIVQELQRLEPQRIVVLGGPGAVSAAVEQQLRQYTPGGVTRLAGANRIDTAVEVSRAVFAPGTSTVYVATSAGFADALAGGPAAGVTGGPILLVTRDSVSVSTADEIRRLAPERIVVLGGGSAVSAQVEQQLREYAPAVGRFSGSDRYTTAVAVSQGTFAPGVARVYLATGAGFADALAGGSPAALAGGPLLLSTRDCLPPAVKQEIDRLAPMTVVLLGGSGALGPGIDSLAVCQPPPPPPPAPVRFGDGTYRIGTDVPAGTYRTRSPAEGCYWERLSGFSGELSDVKANEFSNDVQIVTIDPSDAGFRTDGCGTWTNDLSPLDGTATAPFGPGDMSVGTSADVAPGTWTAPGGDGCYWERLAGFSGEFDDLIANDFGSSGPVVEIDASDAGFSSSDCGTWRPV